MGIQRLKLIPLWIFLGAGSYYYALSSKIFTWVYTSGDAGDWLIQTNWWMVPQCFGKPFYISLIHFTNLFPGDSVLKITMLSIVSGAAMVALTYMIALRMTKSIKLGLIAAAVVLGCNIILSQATVLEQYTVVGALFLAFFYFYQENRLLPAAIFLGLMTATHELGAVFTVLFIFIEWKRRKEIFKFAPAYVLFGLAPYALIVGLMIADTPKLLAGYFSLGSLNSFGGNITSTAALSLAQAPERLKEVAMVLATSLGFSMIPAWVGLRRPWDNKARFILAVFGFSLWFYFTNLFPSTWKYLIPASPLLVCMAMVGLQKLPDWHRHIVTAGAICLIIVNVVLFNTNVLAHEKPLATEYLQAVEALPDGAAVVVPRGGAYGFTVFYVMSEGKDIIPLALDVPTDGWLAPSTDQGFNDFTSWVDNKYGVSGRNTYELVKDAIAKGHPVYFGTPMTEAWSAAFVYEDNSEGYLNRVADVVAEPKWPDTSLAPVSIFDKLRGILDGN